MTEDALVQYKGQTITITFDDVKRLICPMAEEKEVVMFLRTCQSLNLNPFANEIYLIKYSERDRAATVIAIDSYLKAAETNKQYDGHEAGIILKDTTGKLEFREGSFLLDEEKTKLAGGWARVYRKDRSKPFYISVNKQECLRYRKDGNLTEFWMPDKQPSMLRKTALKRALVEAFPSLFSGFSTDVEYEPMPEGELQPAFTNNGTPAWSKFFARQKEKGLSPESVHSILGIESLKTDWQDKGRTLEEADKMINDVLQKASQPQLPRDPNIIKSWGDLYNACLYDFKLTRQQVLAELNASSQEELAKSPGECYREIATVYGTTVHSN